MALDSWEALSRLEPRADDLRGALHDVVSTANEMGTLPVSSRYPGLKKVIDGAYLEAEALPDIFRDEHERDSFAQGVVVGMIAGEQTSEQQPLSPEEQDLAIRLGNGALELADRVLSNPGTLIEDISVSRTMDINGVQMRMTIEKA